MDGARLARARTAVREAGLDALLVGPSADLRYLVGYDAMALERLTMLVVPADGDAELVVPALEEPAATASGAADLAGLRPWTEDEDPIATVTQILGRYGTPQGLAVSDQLFTVFTLRLQDALPGVAFRPSGEVMRELRAVKEPSEIAALHAVGAAIDGVHAQVASLLAPGRTEAEVARDIHELIAAEHDEVAFIIVASGPNGASPHHAVSDRVLERGDAVVVDIGGVKDGYYSDMTRDYAVEVVPDGYAELHAVLEEAQERAVAAVAPGVAAADIDAAARRTIEAAGYGDRFIHRTGHGIGIEVHEQPYIVASNTAPVTSGMAFSIEPGIYIPGRYGARIEDIVVVTDDGVARVNHRPREVLVAG